MVAKSPSNKNSKKIIDVSVIMGSKSDFATLKHCIDILDSFKISYECLVVSAHRTPERMFDFAKTANQRGIKVIIAAAGGAAHLPGMTAALTSIPVIGVPVKSSTLSGVDSLLSIVQMPFGVPVATMAIGEAGAKNAALFAVSILACSDAKLFKTLQKWRKDQTESVPPSPL